MRKYLLLLSVLSLVLAASSGYAVELLGNTSFVDPAPNPVDWQGDSWGSPGIFTVSPGTGAPSVHCFKAVPSPTSIRSIVASAQTLGQAIGGATIYRLTAWYYVSSADLAATGATQARAYMRFEINGGPGAVVAIYPHNKTARDTNGLMVPYDVTIPTNTWTKKSVDFTLPVGTLGYVGFGVYGFADSITETPTTPAPIAYFDDVSVMSDPPPLAPPVGMNNRSVLADVDALVLNKLVKVWGMCAGATPATGTVTAFTITDGYATPIRVKVGAGKYVGTAAQVDGQFAVIVGTIKSDVDGRFIQLVSSSLDKIEPFIITASAGLNGSIVPSGAVTVLKGANQTFTFNAAPGYVPDQVTIDGGAPAPAGASYTFTNVQANHSISVTFKVLVVTFTITSSAGANGTISPTPSATVDQGANQTFNFLPAVGYLPDQVTIDANPPIAAGANYTFINVQANHSISVTFRKPLRDDIPQQGDLLFSAITEMLPAGPAIVNWPIFKPDGLPAALTPRATPTTMALAGNNWEWNQRGTGGDDGFQFGTNYAIGATIPVNGVTIVTAVRPVRNGQADAWTSIVDIFYSRLCIGIRNNTGEVCVKRSNLDGNNTINGPVIPNGQITILSLVVQPAGDWKVYANGVEIMTNAGVGPLVVLDAGPLAHQTQIGTGRGWDSWSAFNGNMGDVMVYKVALDPAVRAALETSLATKFGTAAMFTINASAGAGGTIAPVGATPVPQAANQSFVITPNSFFDVTSVLVDGTTEALVGNAAQTYTFTNVMANHTIAASFAEWPSTVITGTVTANPPNPAGFWNQWYYDGDYLPVGQKTVDIGFNYRRLVSGQEGYVEIWVNWSTPEWSATPGSELAPPLSDSGPLGEPYIGRVKLGELPIKTDGDYTYSLMRRVLMEIPYNPQWVSIDVRGYNVQISDGTLTHECTGDPTPDHGMYWVALAGSSTNWNVIVPGSSGGDGWDGGRWINYPTAIGVSGAVITAIGPRGPFAATTSSPAGTYSIRVRPGDTYALSAFKKGYMMTPTNQSAGPGSLTGKDFVATYVGRQKLIDLKVNPAWINAQSITSWPNTGTLGGNFVSDGLNATAAATVSADYGLLGKKAVSFLASKLMLSTNATTTPTSLIRAPASITGNGAYTVLAELCTTVALPDQQYYFAFGRTGTDSRCAAFGYGNNVGFGAVRHYGGAWDMGWFNPQVTGGPTINAWHYVAVTFDGIVEKVYVDGVQTNTENKTLNVWPLNPLVIGSRYANTDGTTRDYPFNGAMTSLEVYDDAMGAGEVATKSGLLMCKFSGKVTLEDGVTPLAGATVTAIGGAFTATTTSAVDGKYELSLKIGEWYVVGASKTSYLQVNPDYMDFEPMAGDTVYDFQMTLINAVTGTVKDASTLVGIPNAVVQIGVDGPAAITDALGKYTVLSIVPGADVSFYADALGYGEYTEVIDTSAAGFGAITKDVTLAAKAETDWTYIQNGGFETGDLTGWEFADNGTTPPYTVEIGVTNAEKASGSYAGYWKALTGIGYYDGYIRQRIPVIPGSTYNIYWKLMTRSTGNEGQSGFNWVGAGDNWWGYDGLGTNWMYTPVPNVWEQTVNYRRYDNSAKLVAVRQTIPEGVTTIAIIAGLGTNVAGDILYIDDAVIDRVGPLAPPRIGGRITDSSTALGIPYANVTFTPTSGPSIEGSADANGDYLSIVPPNDTYSVVASYSGYVSSAPLEVVVAEVDVLGQDFVLAQSAPVALLVDLDASELTEGAWSTAWNNDGSLAGTFGVAGTAPVVETIVDSNLLSKKAVTFAGGDGALGAGTGLQSTAVTTADFTGNSDWSVSSWVYVPVMPGSSNRTYFSWSSRLVDLSSAELRYNDNRAVAHYSYDYGFAVVPAVGVWHNIIVTYDGAVERLYVDGVLSVTETPALTLKTGELMFLGRATETDQARYAWTGSVASIKVFDQVLKPADIATMP